MLVQEMVYTFKLKADKVDSKSAANISLPAIVSFLNEGMESLIKKRYGGLNTTYKRAFEEIQKRRDEFQRLIVPDKFIRTARATTDVYTASLLNLDDPYMFLLRANFFATKGKCENRKLVGKLIQTDDMDITIDSTLEKSSFEWGEGVYRIVQDKLRIETDGSFAIKSARIDYLRYPKKINIAGYKQFDGSASANANCELPDFLHTDIVDEAAYLYSLALSGPQPDAKTAKLMNNE